MSSFWVNGIIMIMLHIAPTAIGAGYSEYKNHQAQIIHIRKNTSLTYHSKRLE